MTTPSTPGTSDAKHLIALAERMGIPVDEAMRQVTLLIDVAPAAPRPEPEATVAVA
jgi:hypothetical protein